MLEKFLDTLTRELDLPPCLCKENKATFALGDTKTIIQKTDPGYFFTATVHALPKTNQEELFMKVMQGNLLGQGTGGSVIAMDQDEKHFILSRAVGYELDYPGFKELLEEFINYIHYWKEEIAGLDA